MEIKVTNNTPEVLQRLETAIIKALEECGLTAEGYAKQLCPVDTGALRNSISHKVVNSENAVYIGTNMEYAAYVELGTGVYYPGGRKTPWVYEDGNGNWHITNGQRAQPYLKPAAADHADTYRSIIENNLKNA